MTTRISIFSLLLLVAATASAEEQARDIMLKQRQLHRAPEEETRFEMILVDKQGRERERSLTVASRVEDDGMERIRLQFQEPSDIRGVGLLTWETGADREDDQWLYLPARKAAKRIASSGKKNAFMGTDLAFEDLRPENTVANTYEIVREEELEGYPCWVIQASPATDKESRDSGYSKRLLWIRKDIFFTIQVHYFDRRGNLVKTLNIGKVNEIEPGRWRGDESITTTLGSRTSTIMRVSGRTLLPQFAKSHFEPDTLGEID